MTDISGGVRLFDCGNCGHPFQIKRDFCAKCGGRNLNATCKLRQGRVVACTEVHTAPLGSPTGTVPFWIFLIECAEGVRIMANGANPIEIGRQAQVSAADPDHGPYTATAVGQGQR